VDAGVAGGGDVGVAAGGGWVAVGEGRGGVAGAGGAGIVGAVVGDTAVGEAVGAAALALSGVTTGVGGAAPSPRPQAARANDATIAGAIARMCRSVRFLAPARPSTGVECSAAGAGR